MEILWWVLFALLLSCGFLGCFINKVPGPLAVLLATIVGYTALNLPADWMHIGIIAALAVASIITSKILVKLAKKMYEFSKRGSIGATIGSIIGLLLMAGSSNVETWVILLVAVTGLVILPFVFSFLFELTNKNGAAVALKAASAATCAYLADTCLKLVVFVYAIYVMFFG